MSQQKFTATQQRIYDAFRQVLEEEGFQTLGVNRISKVAKVGKPLIYRYFNGLDGLIKTWSEDIGYWRSLKEPELTRFDEVAKQKGINYLVARLVFSTRVIRRNPFLKELMRWKLVENNKLTAIVRQIRENSLSELSQHIPKSDVIEPKIISLLLSNSLLFTVLQAEKKQDWNGLDLKSDASWDKIENHIAFIYEAIEEKIVRDSKLGTKTTDGKSKL